MKKLMILNYKNQIKKFLNFKRKEMNNRNYMETKRKDLNKIEIRLNKMLRKKGVSL